MRAVVCRRPPGRPGGVDDLADPVAGRGQVLVRVQPPASTIPTVGMCQGAINTVPILFVPGNLAGTVAACADVIGFVGDRVAGSVRTGAVELAAVDAGQLRAVPACRGRGGGLPVGLFDGLWALVRRANLQAGETLLVHGAAGGVGLATVDLGRILGARVIVTSASASKRAALAHLLDVSGDFARGQGPDRGRGADVVFDPVGGDVLVQSARCTAFDGGC